MNILVTGASGFIGSALVPSLIAKNHAIVTMGRHCSSSFSPKVKQQRIDSLTEPSAWQNLLAGIDAVVHLAGISSDTDIEVLKKINVDSTRLLVEAAIEHGVKRFIFISSVKAMGESSRHPFSEKTPPHPTSPYGISKWEAEQTIMRCKHKLEYVILRPPMVYGPNVRGNFLQLLKLVRKGFPLPLGMVSNARSLLFIDNIVDAVLCCLDHDAAANQTFLISDNEYCSVPQLLHHIAHCMNKRIILPSVPISLLRFLAALTGKKETISRLTESLAVDISRITDTLNWQPPYSMQEGIQQTVDWFVDSNY